MSPAEISLFPIAPAEAVRTPSERAASAPNRSDTDSRSAFQMLLVGGDAALARVIARALEDAAGQRVVLQRVDTGVAALRLLEQSAVDAVLVDLSCPPSRLGGLHRMLTGATMAPPVAVIQPAGSDDRAPDAALEHWNAVENLSGDRPDPAALKRLIRYARHHRRAAQVARAESDRALARAQELTAAKSQFLTVVSHELRTPINAILGFSEIIHEQMLGPEATDTYCNYAGLINKSGRHLLSLINELLDHAKIEAGQFRITPETVRPEVVCREVLREIRPLADEKAIEITTVFNGGGTIAADSRRLRQMIWNLCSNAIKFTPEGGRITVSSRRSATAFSLVIADTGIGISAADLDQLSRPFFQVDSAAQRQVQGTGLGLSLVRQLMQLHRGDMTIDSTPGEGTRVTLRFPLPPAAQPAD